MLSFFEELRTLVHMRRFAALLQGAPVIYPDGKTLACKITRTFKSVRPAGLRYAPYAFVSIAEIENYVGTGFGEAETKMLAIQKSMAEAFERSIYRRFKAHNPSVLTSNGWAAHVTAERAAAAARNELLERDAVLCHWLSFTPMNELTPDTWPDQLRGWCTDELALNVRFNRLRLLVSEIGFTPTITAVLLDLEGFGVSSHATADTLDSALVKALAEACRIAQIALMKTHLESSAHLLDDVRTLILPEDHGVFYAHHDRFPDWIFGQLVTWNETRRIWAQRRKQDSCPVQFHLIASGPLSAGYATSSSVQQLYLGSTRQALSGGKINLDRLSILCKYENLNFMPHIVP